MIGILTGLILFSSGTLLLVWHRYGTRTAAFTARLATTRGERTPGAAAIARPTFDPGVPPWLSGQLERYRMQLRLAGGGKTLPRFLGDKLVAAAALPLIPLLPYVAVTRQPPSLLLVLVFAAAGFFLPDLGLRQQIKQRRERILLDLPEALSMIALGLGAGQSLRQALALAARDTPGPLGTDLAAALTRARREPALDERQALVQVANEESGEPSFARFAELLANTGKPLPRLPQEHRRSGTCRTEPATRAERRPRLPRDASPARSAPHDARAAGRLRLPPPSQPDDLNRPNQKGQPFMRLTAIWIKLGNLVADLRDEERGDVVNWLIITLGIALAATAVVVVLRPAIEAAGQDIATLLGN